MRSLIGETLGGYRITREIGRGGMAVVYEALQPALNRRVAIKVLPPELAFDETFVQRFAQEAQAAARLSHPNIVAIHDVGRHEDYYYIVMQMLEGEVLSDLIQRTGRLPADRTLRIVGQIASALDYAHGQGLIHRDIKPANIIIGPGDQATLTDFGIAKAAENTRLTRTGMLVGTPQYMSPEQASGKPVGPASDLYALAIVIYQMLAGQVPFQGDSTPALLHQQVYEQPRPVRLHAPDLPPGVDAVLDKALATDPSQRYPSALALTRALGDALAGRPVPVAAASAPTRLMAAPTAPVARRDARRLPILIGLPAALLVILFIVVVIFGRDGPQPSTTVAGLTATALPPSPTAPPTARPTEPPAEPAIAPPVPVPSPEIPALVSRQDVNVYTGPGRDYAIAGRLAPGKELNIVARDAQAGWWLACCVDGGPVWVEAALVDARGASGGVSVATLVSPPFTSTPTLAPPTATLVPPTQPPPTARPLSPTPEPVLSTRTPPPAPTATPKPPLPRVDLAFVGAHPDDYGREIYAYYEGDDTPHRLTKSLENDGYPAVSPGRTLIAFESGRNGGAGSDIWLMNSDGSNQHAITDAGGDDAQPAFSPNGAKIAFISMRTGESKIYLMDLNGGNIQQVPAPGWCFAPSFSPDGKQLVFVSTQGEGVYNVFAVNLDGSGLWPVTSGSSHYENPSFLDGETILFDSDNPGDKQVLRIKVDGTGLTNLTNSPSSDRQPALSWDGSTIAFQRITEGMPHIWLMNRDGGGQRQKTDLGLYGELDPAWSR
jgi:Tol biopolymer transport system component/uncharacterized protein YraI